jgi:glycosyltransferase involved in cell wall biosynthesis
MINRPDIFQSNSLINNLDKHFETGNQIHSGLPLVKSKKPVETKNNDEVEILFITSYPPRVCGIATYSNDLINVLKNKFGKSYSVKVCALESGEVSHTYPDEVKFILDTSNPQDYEKLAQSINMDIRIKIVLIQHEFGFYKGQTKAFLQFLNKISKPIAIVFHTVLPEPNEELRLKVQNIATACDSIIVMTNNSARLLIEDYEIPKNKITVIAHGTHLVQHLSKELLKRKYCLINKKVLTTFGLLSSGKSIETTLKALPAIVKEIPDVVFLVIGKTHPEVVKEEGEKYRESLESLVIEYNLTSNVRFINRFLALPELLEFLQMTDIYLFTTNDPKQAVSGTFAYAMSCACPIISTPIPHAKEVLTDETGIIFDFGNSKQLADGVIRLFTDEPLRKNISTNTLQKIVSTAWENSAIAHNMVFEKILGDKTYMKYDLPALNLNHIREMTTDTGIIQFSKINQPDISSGYTLDDNARALVAISMYYDLTGDEKSLFYIHTYLSFIKRCQLPAGDFLNYIDSDNRFSEQNQLTNLDDANGRAIWALGYISSKKGSLPCEIVTEANVIIEKAILNIEKIFSTRAMAFAIKGLFYYQSTNKTSENLSLIKILATRLVQMYRHESNEQWHWFEGYLTYANSILPEAILYAWLLTGDPVYKEIAYSSLNFLLSQTFNEDWIEVISNKNWLQKGQIPEHFGEQPIDVAYTVMTLSKFYDVFHDEDYRLKMNTAFNWFLGQNRLHQIIYNPCTGGCYDGLEENYVNLNQGAESTVSYLMARLTVEKYHKPARTPGRDIPVRVEKNLKKGKILIPIEMKNSIVITSGLPLRKDWNSEKNRTV